METLNRREFTTGTLGAILTWSLLETISRKETLAGPAKPLVAEWLRDLQQLGRDVKGQRLRQVEWQEKVEELYAKVDLAELLKLLDFEQLVRKNPPSKRGARSIRFDFPKVEGIPEQLVFGKQIFAVQEGRSVVPHGHNNMATAFLILKGEFHGRHFDRIEDADDHLLIKSTIDRTFTAGESSSVSDFKDNIHWFVAKDRPAYIFNIHVLNVAPGSQKPTGRVYLNPNGEKLQGGLIRAPRISYNESLELFG